MCWIIGGLLEFGWDCQAKCKTRWREKGDKMQGKKLREFQKLGEEKRSRRRRRTILSMPREDLKKEKKRKENL